MAKEERPIDRRRFFREGLRELFKPLADVIAPIERAAHELGRLEGVHPPAPAAHNPDPYSIYSGHQSIGPWLRPPGALAEQDFTNACSRCGECVKVCPAHCIKIDPHNVEGNGAPYIDVMSAPCTVCEGLQCMHHCPTGALLPTPLAEVDMGTAVWDAHTCTRAHGNYCSICVDQCPVGSAAIELFGNGILVHEEGCIGCGVCQYQCPTYPKSIQVVPKSARY